VSSAAPVQILSRITASKVDFQPTLARDTDKLASRTSATTWLGDPLRPPRGPAENPRKGPKRLKVIPAAPSIGVDNVDIPAATAPRRDRDEHAVRQFDHQPPSHANLGGLMPGAGRGRFSEADTSDPRGKWERDKFPWR